MNKITTSLSSFLLFVGLNPLAKFKKRRGKPDKTKQFNIGSFLEWFEGSQALERIIILERLQPRSRKPRIVRDFPHQHFVCALLYMLSLICSILPHRRGMTPDEQIVTELLYMVKVNLSQS